LVVLAIAAEYVARNAEPILRRRVVAELEARFHSPVELDALQLSLLHGLQASGTGLRIFYLAGPDLPGKITQRGRPMLSVQSFQFRTGLREIFEPTTRILTVYVQGIEVHIPPAQDRGPLLPTGGAKRSGQPRIALIVDKIVCTGLRLVIETDKPDKPPLVFNIGNVTLTGVGRDQPFLYDASLVNPKPVGDIHATGHFGPWQSDNPRETPIDGRYAFSNADLATIKGIAGTLSSTGDFSGVLGKIGVAGSTDTPNFSLDVAGHPVPLHTDFQAIVDGTSGDTTLQQVRATLLHTVLVASGTIFRSRDEARTADSTAASGDPPLPGDSLKHVPGHDIELTVSSDQARIEDILALGAKTTPPILRGALSLKTKLSIPPGHVSVTQKMHLQGTFSIRGATFANAHWQQTIDSLSKRAQGQPKQANPADAPVVASQMSGGFELASALIHIPTLNYQLPGAQVHLAGDYSLSGEKFDFAGTVRTQATASQMLTGWKSLLAKPFDGLLKKNGAGLEVPIKVTGTKSDPKFGVDLDKMGLGFLSHRKDDPNSAPPPSR